jgi:copper homeostasis protein
MNGKFILEITVESTGAALAAERGGADRIELCADLRSGGLTPSRELMNEARTAVRLPIHVMIRPRAWNFVYNDEEFAEMKGTIALARELKMDGVVFGILRADNTIDSLRTRALVEFAKPLQVTFHRAFDKCNDLLAGLEDGIATGANRILTSGGAKDVVEGIEPLRTLLKRAGKRIVIMPGGGIQPANFAGIQKALGATEYHSGLGTLMAYGSADLAAFEQRVGRLKYEE